MRRIADQRQPFAYEAPRDLKIEGEGLARAGKRDIAKPRAEALGELGEEHEFVGRHDRLARRLVFRPYDGAAIAFERQHGKGTAWEKMLHGFAVMRLRMRHSGDDAELRIAPADAFDASTLAQARALAIGGDEELSPEPAAACKSRFNGKWRRREGGDAVGREHLDGRRAENSAPQSADEILVLDHIGAGFARLEIVVEAEEMRAALCVERTVGDLDSGDGLGVAGKRGPNAENGEQALARRRQRRGAGVWLRALRRLGIDQGHAKALWRRSAQGKRKRHADKAAAGDDQIVGSCLGHGAFIGPARGNRNPSFAPPSAVPLSLQNW